MKEMKAIIEPYLVQNVLESLGEIPGLPGVVLWEVIRCGQSVAGADSTQGVKQMSLEIVVPNLIAAEVAEIIARAAHSDGKYDGRILATNIDGTANIRDIESGVVR